MTRTASKTFKDLVVWQEGHKLVLIIYKLTKAFPREEQFALTSQLRRAAVSITSNIAEGYGRRQPKDKEHFYQMAKGSLDEVANQVQIARDLGYMSGDQADVIDQQQESVSKLLSALLRTHRTV